MITSRHPKDDRLTPFIDTLWTCEINNGSGLELVLPNGRAQLLFNLHQDALHNFHPTGGVRQRASGMVVQGPLDAPIVVDRAEQRRLCGVSFSAGGAFAFFGGAISEIPSELVDLNALSWTDQLGFYEKLLMASDPTTRLDLLELALLGHAPISSKWDNIVHRASPLLRNGASVRDVAMHFDVSQQTFITRFRERTGLTPKTFSRIERFQRLLRNQCANTTWSEAALDAGYSDQSHMVREFRHFSGLSPTQYDFCSNQPRNHVVLST